MSNLALAMRPDNEEQSDEEAAAPLKPVAMEEDDSSPLYGDELCALAAGLRKDFLRQQGEKYRYMLLKGKFNWESHDELNPGFAGGLVERSARWFQKLFGNKKDEQGEQVEQVDDTEMIEQLVALEVKRIAAQLDAAPEQTQTSAPKAKVDEAALKKSTERLKFDELLLLQLQAEDSRKNRLGHSAPQLTFHQSALQEFVGRLPFTLTKTQKIAAWEILQDIQKSTPMNRLLSGDVGSGKTVVAAMALYSAFLNGYQGVLMAPTEILAEQH